MFIELRASLRAPFYKS